MRIGFCWLVFSCTLMVACTKHSSMPEKNAQAWLSKCPDFSITGKAVVAENAQCGGFDVKENPQDEHSELIHINVLRIPSINPVPKDNPLFIIAGGPGQAATEIAAMFYPYFIEVRKNRDLIFVDQRGTGQSHPLNCPFSDNSNFNLTRDQANLLLDQFVTDCIKQYGDHLRYYSTPLAVQDLEQVRVALGYPTINLWGGSYGTRVALEYMREYPTHTRTAIIDGVAPSAIALPWNLEIDALEALKKISQQCSDDTACTKQFGNVFEKAKQVSDQLREKPANVDIRHPGTQKKMPIHISSQGFAGLIRLALYDRDLSSLLPQIISNTADGDYQLLGSLIFMASSRTDLSNINQAMHFSVVCSEDYPQYAAQLNGNLDAPAQNVFFNLQSIAQYARVCARWPHAELPKDYWQYAENKTPTLILSGAVDPVTPPRWADSVKTYLPNSLSLVAPGGHHIITPFGCTAQLINLFIDRGDVQGIDGKCVENIQPLPIHLLPQEKSSASSINAASVNASSENSSQNISSASNSAVHKE